jgi:hypothetical protein
MKRAACRQAAALQLKGVLSEEQTEIVDGEDTVPPSTVVREEK